MTIDLRFIPKPDGLYRICIVCGREFKIESTLAIIRETKDGFIKEVCFGDRHPRNLMQVQCNGCPEKGGRDHAVETTAGPTDPRWQLRRDGLESWRDYNG